MSVLPDADRAHLAKNYVEAAALYRQVLAHEPASFDALHGLAAASASMEEYGDAAWAFREALELQPDNARLRVNLACALFSLGRVSEAVRAYRIAASSPDAAARAMAIRNLACIAPGDPALDNAAILKAREAWAAEEIVAVASHSTWPPPPVKSFGSPITAPSSPPGTG